MNHIGKVIRDLRDQQGVNRVDLCAGICTDKYLYMIERGTRTPSTEILRFLGNRLHVDLFSYYEYIDCADPVRTRALILKIDDHRYMSRFDLVDPLILRAAKMADFRHDPLKQYLEFCRISVESVGKRNFKGGVERLIPFLAGIPARYAGEPFVIEAHALLAYCYQFLCQWDKAEAALLECDKQVQAARLGSGAADARISYSLMRMTLAYHQKDYERTLQESSALIKYQLRLGRIRRMHLCCFFIAYALLHQQRMEAAVQWFKKGLYVVLFQRMNSFYPVAHYPEFTTLLKHPGIPKSMVEDLKAMYDHPGFTVDAPRETAAGVFPMEQVLYYWS